MSPAFQAVDGTWDDRHELQGSYRILCFLQVEINWPILCTLRIIFVCKIYIGTKATSGARSQASGCKEVSGSSGGLSAAPDPHGSYMGRAAMTTDTRVLACRSAHCLKVGQFEHQ